MNGNENKKQKLLIICQRQIRLEETKHMKYKRQLANKQNTNDELSQAIIQIFYLIPIGIKLRYLKKTLEQIHNTNWNIYE